jgi:hypothetical protein
MPRVAQTATLDDAGGRASTAELRRAGRCSVMPRRITSRFAPAVAPAIVVTSALSPSAAWKPRKAPARLPASAATKPAVFVDAERTADQEGLHLRRPHAAVRVLVAGVKARVVGGFMSSPFLVGSMSRR